MKMRLVDPRVENMLLRQMVRRYLDVKEHLSHPVDLERKLEAGIQTFKPCLSAQLSIHRAEFIYSFKNLGNSDVSIIGPQVHTEAPRVL
jgi:hypothetical protein